jgi:hypothetical protein
MPVYGFFAIINYHGKVIQKSALSDYSQVSQPGKRPFTIPITLH